MLEVGLDERGVGEVAPPSGLLVAGLVASGLVASGLEATPDGLAERGLAERGLAERGLAERGLAERGLAAPSVAGVDVKGLADVALARGLLTAGLAEVVEPASGFEAAVGLEPGKLGVSGFLVSAPDFSAGLSLLGLGIRERLERAAKPGAAGGSDFLGGGALGLPSESVSHSESSSSVL